MRLVPLLPGRKSLPGNKRATHGQRYDFSSIRLKQGVHSRDEAPHAAKVKFARLRKDLEEWGRGFSINQVQNGGADPLWRVDLSASFVLPAPTTATPCKLAPIEMAGDCSAGSFPSRVRTNMTTITFIPNRRQDFSGPLIKIGLLNAKRLLTFRGLRACY